MLIPPPLPAYTLAPDIDSLTPGQQRALEGCLISLSGRSGGVIVTGAHETDSHDVLEIATALGPMIVMERSQERSAAPHV